MALRNKSGLRFFVILVVIAVAVAIASRTALFVSWLDGYVDAVETAQGDDDEPLPKRQVQIDDEMRDYAGVELLSLVERDFSPELQARARLVDLKPLLALRSRYHQTLASEAVAKVVERAARDELARLKKLAKGAGSVAVKKVNYARAIQGEAKAKLEGVRTALQSLHDESMHSFGSELTPWLLDKNSKQWQRLLAHQDALLLVTLPVNTSLAANVLVIRVATNNDRAHARKAYFISSAFMLDQQVLGEQYFFKTAGARLHAGQRLDAWLPQGDKVLKGVFIPNKAIIWNAGQAWVYVEVETGLYHRRAVQGGFDTAGGMMMTSGFNEGDKLVLTGAQMLLSQEFKWQIADEDD